MIPLVSRMMDAAADNHFMKDRTGRLVFVPTSLRRRCYFVDSKADEEKIRALVRMFRSAIAVIPLVTYPIMAVPGLILENYGGLSPRGHRLTIALGIPLFLWLVLTGFIWMLWSLYKGVIPGLTASLREVGPDVMGELREFSRRVQHPILLVVCGLLMLGLTLFAFLAAYHFRR
ncbi:MAG TPA: hypothetical protein VKH63_19565 [Candidatus Acidoferrum sp.]|jgi:hypothetical protein|nr:hypothetical protein [Candidatus Acidoferrum sp.]